MIDEHDVDAKEHHAMTDAQILSVYLLYYGRPFAGGLPSSAEMRAAVARMQRAVLNRVTV